MLTLPDRNVTETGESRESKPGQASTASRAAQFPVYHEDQSFLTWGKTDLTTVSSGSNHFRDTTGGH